jgi:phosphatidylglycerophosphate synthase
LLVGTTLLMLAYDNTIDGPAVGAAAIILCREILVSGLREFLAELNVKVHVTRLAKWKTTLQMIALGILVAGPAGDKSSGRDLDRSVAVDGAADALDRLRLPEAAIRTAMERKAPHAGEDLFRLGAEKTGKAEEIVDVPANVNGGGLVAWLKPGA